MKSEVGKTLYSHLQAQVTTCLRSVDDLAFPACEQALGEARSIIEEQQLAHAAADDDTLNDLAVLNFYIEFFSNYAKFWEKVAKQEYDSSWTAIQDVLDSLRLLKRLSNFDLCRFETQVVDFESTYPFAMFASIGAIAELIECSICGNDIDSFSCPHRRGELYRGKLAHGIIQKLKSFDHLAMTETPQDKRCVMKLQGREYQYPAVDWFAQNLNARTFVVSQFSHVQRTQRRLPNPDYVRLGRNEPCFCGSGKKFKICCIDRSHTTNPHASFVLNGTHKAVMPRVDV